jgi:large conductance mechanosensitive channel
MNGPAREVEEKGLRMLNEFREFAIRVTANNLADAKKQGAVLAWGNFLTLTLNFIIVAFVIFLAIRSLNRLKRRDEAAPPPKPTRQEELLTEIRDLLKSLDVRGLKPSDTAAGLK